MDSERDRATQVEGGGRFYSKLTQEEEEEEEESLFKADAVN